MSIPLAFLAGLTAIFTSNELYPAIPGSRSFDCLLFTAGLVLVPVLLAAWACRLVRRQVATGHAGAVPPRAILRLSGIATPLAMLTIMLQCHYGDFVEHVAWDSHLGRLSLCLLPLYLAEMPRLVWATAAQLLLEVADENQGVPQTWHIPLREFWPLVRLRFGWPLLMLLPIVMLGSALDLLSLDRGWYAFLLGSSLGVTLGTFALMLVTFALFPLWFRVAFGTDKRLPEPIGTRLRATAAALGFAPSRVLLLPTGMRTMNAMMVGPLPLGRCLCVTDGLLTALDSESLSGVIAHEVGHARMGHPGLLISLVMVVPLLLMVPLRFIDMNDVGIVTQVGLGLVAVVAILLITRTLAHRFEHEADVASVRALGSGPCSRALLLVARTALPIMHSRLRRLWTMHPDERHRTQLMQRYEVDAQFRGEFDATGRRLRRGIAAAVLGAMLFASWAWLVDWPYESVLWHYNVGDHVAARHEAAALGEVPPRWRTVWKNMAEELDAASQIVPDAHEWSSTQAALATAAWPRTIEVLVAEGPESARPWCALALNAIDHPSDLQRAIGQYCDAAAAHDVERMRQIADVLRGQELPRELAPVFRGQ